MTIGNRIKQLRKDANYSQEYIAEQLNVSRQAVSKWERDVSHPDTQNVIQLAALFHTTVEYILTGRQNDTVISPKNRPQPKARKNIGIIIAIFLLYIGFFSTVIYIHTRPVDWDAGACSGGYATWIFDKYGDALTESFIDSLDKDNEKIISLKAIRGSQSATWTDRSIFLRFDIEYEHTDYGPDDSCHVHTKYILSGEHTCKQP